jgi:hypothetical protein
MSGAEPNLIVPGRSCEGCTLCCKLLDVPELNKPRFTWCKHCDVTKGCTIWTAPERPSLCGEYFCAWMLNPALGPEWRPAESKMVISYDAPERRVVVSVDPSRADAWKRQPFYRQIKNMAMQALRNGGHLLVWQGRHAIVVLPDKDVMLGVIEKDAVIVVSENRTPMGVGYDAAAYAPDDPKLKAMGYAG